ncbi:hypothetical protein V8G54_005760 [Vigna mungo]|uniref:Uncharacterized protein n=1 Tax=Vigna mungo TaxID=3915 RepID=A0AAQ3S6Q7_VIGMU
MARVVGDAKEEEEFYGLRRVLLDEANSGNAMHESRDEDRADTSDEHDEDGEPREAMALRFKKIEASESSRLKVSIGEIAILPRVQDFSPFNVFARHGEDKGLRDKIEEENQEKKSLETAQRQNCTTGRPNARRWHKCDAGRLPVGLGPIFCCAPQL